VLDQRADHELAGRVDDRPDHDHRRDQPEVAILEHELEPTFFGVRRVGDVRMHDHVAVIAFAPRVSIDHPVDHRREAEADRGEQHQLIHAERMRERLWQERADDRADAAAEPERPEVRDHEHVEDADPQKEREPDRRLRIREQVERDQAADEERLDRRE